MVEYLLRIAEIERCRSQKARGHICDIRVVEAEARTGRQPRLVHRTSSKRMKHPMQAFCRALCDVSPPVFEPRMLKDGLEHLRPEELSLLCRRLARRTLRYG